jgi:hypothetical protein
MKQLYLLLVVGRPTQVNILMSNATQTVCLGDEGMRPRAVVRPDLLEKISNSNISGP